MTKTTAIHPLSLLLLLMGCTTMLLGQNQQLYRYTEQDGLPTNYVYGVIEDDDGYIWAYTEQGIAKFDGYTFEDYHMEDGLATEDIPMGHKSANGHLFFITYNDDLTIFSDGVFTTFPGKQIRHYFSEGRLIYHTTSDVIMCGDTCEVMVRNYPDLIGASIFDKDWVDSIIYPANEIDLTQESARNTIVRLGNDSLIRMKKGLYTVAPNFLCSHLIYDASRDCLYKIGYDQVDSAYLDDMYGGEHLSGFSAASRQYFINNNDWSLIWKATEDRILILHEDLDSCLDLTDTIGLSQGREPLVCAFIDDHVVLGVRGIQDYLYIVHRSGRLVDRWRVPNELRSKYLINMFEDRHDNLWIGTRESGLYMLPAAFKGIRHYRDFTESDKVFELLLALEGQVIGLTDIGGIYAVDHEGIQQVHPPDEKAKLTDAWVEDGGFFTVDYDSIRRFDLDDGQRWRIRASWPDRGCKEVLVDEDARRRYCLMSYGGRTQPLDQIIDYTDSPSSETLATDDGYLIRDSVIVKCYAPYEVVAPIPPEAYGPLSAVRIDGQLWLMTSRSGVYRMDVEEKKWIQTSTINGVRKIIPQGHHTLWLASSKGLGCIKKEGQNYTDTLLLDYRRGLLTDDVYDVVATEDDLLYLATAEGVHQVDLTSLFVSPLDSICLRLSSIISPEGEMVNITSALETDQRDLTFHYVLLSYASAGQVEYEVMLKPMHAEWISTNEKSIRFSALHHGQYTFHLRARDAFGQTYEHAPVAIRILPQWHERWYLQLAAILAAILLLYYWIRRSFYRHQQRMEHDAKLQHQLVELKHEALRSQMNPHFVFNALGSIQYFIQTQDAERADDYLTKFALLMRKYLNSSKEKFTSINEEVELLAYYMELEAMRFEHIFDWSIETDDNLQEEEYDIPTMIVQPYVENAINHGLLHREDGQGQVTVSFSAIQNGIRCEIKDNGIGIEAAKKYRKKNHKSRGRQLIQEKIAVLNNSGLANISVQTKQLDDKDKRYPGTLVTLNIQYE